MHRLRITLLVCLQIYLYAPGDRHAANALLGDEPLRLAHRWEVEPDLGIVWLAPEIPPAISLEPTDFQSSNRQVLLDAARTAARWAHLEKLPGREESRSLLLEQLKNEHANRHLRLSLAAAAIALCDASQAPQLWQLLKNDDDTRPVIERALIDWKSPEALELWRARLLQDDASLADLRLAIEGLTVCGNSQDGTALQALLFNDRMPTTIQAIVSHALGTLVHSDLEGLAEQIVNSDLPHRQLLSAEILLSHTSSQAQRLLQTIIDSDHGPASNIAYAAIAQNFPELARELAPDMLAHADNNLRGRAIEVLNRFDDPESLRIQAQALADPVYKLRVTVRENMELKAQQPDLLTVINEVIEYQFKEGTAGGIVQALQLSVGLGQTERCPQYLDLLEHPSPEVALVAAWGLQELADQPEWMEAIMVHVRPLTERLAAQERTTFPEHLRQAFLFEALGRNRYQPAVELLRRYIPKKHTMGDFNRASAIWALGKILEGSQDKDISDEIAMRMLDESVIDPEDPLVQFNATVAVGWINAPGSLEQVMQMRDTSESALGTAGHWAKEKLQAAGQ
jgi:hypothetical protein